MHSKALTSAPEAPHLLWIAARLHPGFLVTDLVLMLAIYQKRRLALRINSLEIGAGWLIDTCVRTMA